MIKNVGTVLLTSLEPHFSNVAAKLIPAGGAAEKRNPDFVFQQR